MSRKPFQQYALLGGLIAVSVAPSFAQSDTLPPYEADYLDDVTVIRRKGSPRLFKDVPGSATYVDKEEMQLIQPLSANDVLQRVPGVNVVSEEGAGLRPNFGIRGLDPDRSRRVLVLEDGVPFSLNPYGEPEMYVAPPIQRMEAIEVLKGSGSIEYGPQTVGGVINYVTAAPPTSETARIRVMGGQGGYFSGFTSYGNTVGKTGFQLSYLHNRADKQGLVNYGLHDVSGKVIFQTGEKSTVTAKVGVYTERSNATYVGLTQPMWDNGFDPYTTLMPDDELNVNRFSASLSHRVKFSDRLELKTTGYAYTTTRNWSRQDFSIGGDGVAPPSNWDGTFVGDTTVANGAIFRRASNGQRNRTFRVAGVEPRVKYRYELGGRGQELRGGVRFNYEDVRDLRVNGQSATDRSGTLVNDEFRYGRAFSAFVANDFHVGEKLSITPGLRFEHYAYTRHRLREGSVIQDTVGSGSVSAIIPGLGLSFSVSEQLTVFGGIHRGFAPPAVADAIANDGDSYQLDAELSWNSELGLRAGNEVWGAELTGFYYSFQNQIIPVSESSGGLGIGNLNGGETVHRGVEVAGRLDVLGAFTESESELKLDAALTIIDAFFSSDRFIDGENIKDNKTPYTPSYLVTSAITYRTPMGVSVRLAGNFQGEQYADPANLETPTPDGREGLIPGFWTLSGSLQYKPAKLPMTFIVSGQNLTDQRYIASRRPQGIRPGLPRFITAGIDLTL